MATREVRQYLLKEYADALHDSPIWVRVAFKSYLLLPNKLVLSKPFLYFVLGKGTLEFKMDKYTANYGLSKVLKQKCINCVYAYKNIVKDKFICSQIKGEIEPLKWCRLWLGGESKNEISYN